MHELRQQHLNKDCLTYFMMQFKTKQQQIDYIENRHLVVGEYLYSRHAGKHKAKVTSLFTGTKNLNQLRIGYKYGLYTYDKIVLWEDFHQNWLTEWEHKAFL